MRDEVDELVEAWERERDDLDLAPVAVFSRISRLARHLDLARRQAFTEHGIESWEFDVLSALRRAGRAVRAVAGTAAARDAGDQRHDDQPGGPARRARAASSATPTPPTGAACIVRLTPEGKAAVDGAFEALLEAERGCSPTCPRGPGAAGRAAAHPAGAVLLRQ